MNEDFFSDGVPLDQLKKWLGEPLVSTSDDDPTLSVRVTHRTAGVLHEIKPISSEVISWDCLGYERTFREIQKMASGASESNRDMVVQALFTSSQMHLISLCRAERVGKDSWILQHLCVKHICEVSASNFRLE